MDAPSIAAPAPARNLVVPMAVRRLVLVAVTLGALASPTLILRLVG